MNAKEIGRKAGRIFESQLPDHWIFRSQEDQEDYGIDGELELADSSDHATGFIFKVQIKGQKSVSIIHGGSLTSFSLSVERLNYYMSKIEIPVILIVVDITTEVVYWKSLQDDEILREALSQAKDKSQDTVSVHISTSNTLKDKPDELLAAVETNMNWLRVNALNRMTAPIDNLLKKSSSDILAEMLENSKRFNFQLYSETFERLFLEGNFEELYSMALDVLDSTTEKVETRFTAGYYIEKVYVNKYDRTNLKLQNLSFQLFSSLVEIARETKAPENIRLYALLLIRSL